MYYKEKVKDGKIYFKLTPNEEWREFTITMYKKRAVELTLKDK